MKKVITIAIIIIVLIALIFIKFNYKKIKIGNNMSSKSVEEIAEYILDINSYEAKEEITVESNKNTNKYVVIEKCNRENNLFSKEVLEPENLNGMKFSYDGTNLKIENNKLNLSKIYENYPYIGEEDLSLMDFINSYKEAESTKIEEVNNEIIITIKLKNGNKYVAYKKLYIDKSNGNPIKMQIQNISQKEVIYILYNEIKINNLR
ncbi:MAG: hypothetical protein J5507_04355 [Clostridia bacterium]|nr:hypothetical protein [Clostridia bacterium]